MVYLPPQEVPADCSGRIQYLTHRMTGRNKSLIDGKRMPEALIRRSENIMGKRKINDLQYTTKKTKDCAVRTQ